MAGRLGWREAILGEQQIDDFLGRFRSQFGRDDDEGLGAAVKIGGKVEGGGGGEREVEHRESEDFGFGGWGVREGGGHQSSGLARCRDRIALACASLEAGREAVRVHGQIQPRDCVRYPAGVEAGRAGGELAPQREQLRRRP